MEAHRSNPGCAVCHVRMDPLGFLARELRRAGWRTVSDGASIDASASLPDGTRFEGIAGLLDAAAQPPRRLRPHVHRKAARGALGRGVEHYDLPTVRAVVRDAAADDYRWSSLILGIVKSRPFSMSTSAGAPSAQSTAAR